MGMARMTEKTELSFPRKTRTTRETARAARNASRTVSSTAAWMKRVVSRATSARYPGEGGLLQGPPHLLGHGHGVGVRRLDHGQDHGGAAVHPVQGGGGLPGLLHPGHVPHPDAPARVHQDLGHLRGGAGVARRV